MKYSIAALVVVEVLRNPAFAGAYKCFAHRNELESAVDSYIENDCANTGHLAAGDLRNPCNAVVEEYGWPINSWCVSQVTDMSNLFHGKDFNEDISDWDVSSVTDMQHMFRESTFNGNLSAWNTSSVMDFYAMFWYAQDYEGGDIGSWDTSSATRMYAMFEYARNFDGDISNWNVTSVENFYSMFHGATSFNKDLSSWQISPNANIGWMFNDATSFSQDLCAWGDNNIDYRLAYDIFKGSGCTYEDDPRSDERGPFCASSCILPTSIPSTSPAPIVASTPSRLPTASPISMAGLSMPMAELSMSMAGVEFLVYNDGGLDGEWRSSSAYSKSGKSGGKAGKSKGWGSKSSKSKG